MRCSYKGCKKKISLIEQQLVCRCGECFCIKHRSPELHCCTFNYKNQNQSEIKIEELKCVASKIDKI